jgi:hypothetical protein
MRGWRRLGVVCGLLLGVIPCACASARAATTVPDYWLPNNPSASWTYGWSDDHYAKPTHFERYTVTRRSESDV